MTYDNNRYFLEVVREMVSEEEKRRASGAQNIIFSPRTSPAIHNIAFATILVRICLIEQDSSELQDESCTLAEMVILHQDVSMDVIAPLAILDLSLLRMQTQKDLRFMFAETAKQAKKGGEMVQLDRAAERIRAASFVSAIRSIVLEGHRQNAPKALRDLAGYSRCEIAALLVTLVAACVAEDAPRRIVDLNILRALSGRHSADFHEELEPLNLLRQADLSSTELKAIDDILPSHLSGET